MTCKTKLSKLSGQVAKAYEPKASELAAAQAFLVAKAARTPRPAVKVTPKDNTVLIDFDHPDGAMAFALIGKALGTTDTAFSLALLTQLGNASGRGPVPCEQTINFMLSVIDGVAPRDQMEAMLAAQMAAVHCAMMTFARRLNHVDNLIQQDAAERAFNKLARTFAVQIEALKRYRTGGEQKVVVQHVHVNEGGQAIVGNVAPAPTRGGGGEIPEATP